MSNIVVRPDKNEFLLYSMLDSLGLARGSKDSHYIRRTVADAFENYEGIGLEMKDYGHHSKPVTYVLTITEAPEFEGKECLELDEVMKNEVMYGRNVLPHLKHFYENTDFENVYGNILPFYQKECEFLQGVMKKSCIAEILDDVWKAEFPMEVLPMPLEGKKSGVGPSIGKISYQIVGPPFDDDIVFLIAHEGSHPRAKAVLEPIKDEISKRDGLLKNVKSNPNYPVTYNNWDTCFEEHFIRTVQACRINPELAGNAKSVKKTLLHEYRDIGMVYIMDFADVIMNNRSVNKSMTEVAFDILENLDRNYKS